MSRVGTIARRTFLVGSAAVAGGVAFGAYAYNRTPPNPLSKGLKNGEAALTPYVRVDQGGVTIITPRADIGQGAYSILAALVAEELDLDWKDIKVEPGPPSAAYYNGKVLAEGFPVAATDDGLVARKARFLGDVVGKLMGMQLTGGSSTVADAYEKMRMAGATAREALLLAAAKETGIAKSSLRTRDGAVVTPDGRSLSYASLAAAAATVDLPTNVPLRPKEQWRYLGKPMRRIDIVAKSTGTAVFGIDLKMPGMVYATVRTNPRLGGRLTGYDASAAETARGVLKVVPIAGGVGVIADNTWRAFKAANLIKFDWGPAPYPATTEAMFETVARSFRGRHDSRCKNDGDVESALRGPGIIQAEYTVPYLAHAPLEPMNAVVQLKDGRLDIWTGTQIPRMLVAAAASMTGLAEDNVHLHAQISGGSFGRRLEDDYVRQAVELAKAFQGRPIKMTWSREEDMTHDFPRPLGMAQARGRVKNGEVDSYDLKIAYPSVTASQLGRQNLSIPLLPDVAIVAGAWDQPFKIPNYRVTGYRAPEMVPVSSWRSVGASSNGFLHDCFLDELIYAAGADPLKERIRLCWHEPSRKVLEAVGEMSNWGSDLGKDRGRGVAFTLSFGVPVAEVVEVTHTPRGIRIDNVFVALDVGKVLDPENFTNQVQGGVIWGLGHAMNAAITYRDGIAEQTNYHAFEGMRLYQTPKIAVRPLPSDGEIRGIGEPAVPPAAPALANAIFAATGKRIRELPLNRQIGFV